MDLTNKELEVLITQTKIYLDYILGMSGQLAEAEFGFNFSDLVQKMLETRGYVTKKGFLKYYEKINIVYNNKMKKLKGE